VTPVKNCGSGGRAILRDLQALGDRIWVAPRKDIAAHFRNQYA